MENSLPKDNLSSAAAAKPDSQSVAQEEEIIIKCPLEEIIKAFFKDYAIIWHDPRINSEENQKYITQLQQFCQVSTFTEWQKAKDYLQTTHSTCHVITSGTNGELLVKEIDQLQSVIHIYVFCANKEYHSSWAKNYPKVSCVETDIKKVLSQIQQNLLEWYKQASSMKLNLPAFAPIFNDSDKSQMNNLHRFLRVLPNFKNRLQAKNDFIQISKVIYSDPNSTKLIADFEQNYNEYDKQQTLRWYTQESFLYKVTNNCLRIATSDSIQYCRLLLKDIEMAIKEQYQTKSKNFSGLLYRGAYLSDQEWSTLKTNLNQEIEMHGFLSVSKEESVALSFMHTDPSSKVLITIIVPKGPNEEEQGFAEVEEFSQFPQEKEILFNVRSRFTILQTEEAPYRHLVLLYGAQGFRKFMTEKNPTIEIPILQDVSCHKCKAPKSDPNQVFFISLKDPQKHYCKDCIDDNFSPFLYLPKISEPNKIIKISGCLLKTTESPFYGYKCSSGCQAKKQKQYFVCPTCNEKWCQNCFENSHNPQHSIVLETSPFSFWFQKMSETEQHHLSYQKNLVTDSIFQQAVMYFENHNYGKAIEYYNIYIQQNESKGNNINLATSYHNLGYIKFKQGEYKRALEYFFKALDMKKSIYGDNHWSVASTLNSIGLGYVNQGEYAKALEYHFKALEIRKSVFGDKNAHVGDSYGDIGSVYNKQGEYKKSIEFKLKCMEIYKLVYGDSHPHVATIYNNLGHTYGSLKETEKALEYQLKALVLYKSFHGDNHPNVAICYYNIALVYRDRGETEKALEYFEKSLTLDKSFFGDKHPSLITSYIAIGIVYRNQRDYMKALEYYENSLDIAISAYGKNHPDVARAYKQMAIVYHRQIKYEKALEYYTKAVEIFKAFYPENSSEILTTQNAILQIQAIHSSQPKEKV